VWTELDKKQHFSRFYGSLRLSCSQETVLPQTNGTNGKPRLWRCALCSGESMTRHLADIGPWRVLKSGHVTITRIENLQIDTRRKIHWFQNAILFDPRLKITKVSRKNRFRTVASPGAWPSWIDARRLVSTVVPHTYQSTISDIQCW